MRPLLITAGTLTEATVSINLGALAAAPAGPVKGTTYFDTTLLKMRTWNGSGWDSWQ